MVLDKMNSTNLSNVVLLLTVISFVTSQGIKNCHRIPSQIIPGQFEVYCSCMEQLVEWKDPIYKLTINQTGCRANTLRLDWTTLQSYVGVQVVNFDSASITFQPNKEINFMNCSVTELVFYNSEFKSLPSDALYGLHKLKTLRILGGRIGEISSKAFSGYHLLKSIEFAGLEIGRVKANAFEDLPQIEDLAFIRSKIDVIESNAIKLLAPPRLPTAKCPVVLTRSRSSMDDFVTEFSGRSLQSANDITLPEYGARLFFFTCDIGIVESAAIMTNVFPYIILAGNGIKTWKSLAIESRIENDCDVAAFLLIHNNFTKMEANSFKGVTGDHQTSYNTVMAVIKNLFYTVATNGFIVNKDISVPYISGNQFECDCRRFYWVVQISESNSKVQNALEGQLVNSSLCLEEGKPFFNFFLQCTTDPNVVFFTEDTNTGTLGSVPSTTYIPETSQTEAHIGNSAAFAVSSHYFVTLMFINFVTKCLC